MKTIIFDQTSPGWHKHDEFNRLFIQRQCDYLWEKLQYTKYLYLNVIYETFGVAWNPDWENTCYRNADKFNIGFEPGTKDGEYVIKIY
jgi:hypothetical protein